LWSSLSQNILTPGEKATFPQVLSQGPVYSPREAEWLKHHVFCCLFIQKNRNKTHFSINPENECQSDRGFSVHDS
jgi:hypothetical protein